MDSNRDINAQLRWLVAKENPPSIAHVALTAIATVLSYFVACRFHLPEAYWGPNVDSDRDAADTQRRALPVAVQYIAGTAGGAAVGAAINAYRHGSMSAFPAAIVLVGLLCVILRVERSAFRYAGITLVIAMLVPRSTSGRLVALHRFLEVSIGIAVGLALFMIWQRIGLRLSVKTSQASSA